MSETTPVRQTGQVYQVGTCTGCGEQLPIICKGVCRRCYNRARRARLVGVCRACGKANIQLQARGMCQPCYHAMPKGDDLHHRRVLTEDELGKLDRDARETFVEHVLPVVVRHASRRFRGWDPSEREEALQEVQAMAWQMYARRLASGKEVTSPAYIAKVTVRAYRHWFRLQGKLRVHDVLSQRAAYEGRVAAYSLSGADFSGDLDELGSLCLFESALVDGRVTNIPSTVALKVDLETWLSSLDSREQEIASFLSEGHTVDEAALQFGLGRAQVARLRTRLWHSWVEFQQGKSANS